MNDTSPAVQKRYDEMMAALSPADRFRMASRMFQSAKRLAAAGILHDQPDIDDAELNRRVFVRFYGCDYSPEQIERIFAAIPSLRRTS